MKMSTFPELQDRCVVVTGGAQGIGEAIVRAFHAQGARVFFCDCEADAGRALADELSGGAHFTKVDLRHEKEICRWIAGIGKQAGHIDALVNNAATDRRCPLGKMSAADWDQMF